MYLPFGYDLPQVLVIAHYLPFGNELPQVLVIAPYLPFGYEIPEVLVIEGAPRIRQHRADFDLGSFDQFVQNVQVVPCYSNVSDNRVL